MRNEMEELRKVAEAFNTIKNNLIDFKNIVAWLVSPHLFPYAKFSILYLSLGIKMYIDRCKAQLRLGKHSPILDSTAYSIFIKDLDAH